MQRERVADDIYVFTSDVYAQVTAGAVITSDGAILIDTLLFPEETRSIRLFVEGRLGSPVKYVINTHYHADHTY
jgi:cyclase